MLTANLGFPRIGRHRELKFVLERFWSGDCGFAEVEATSRELRKTHWQIQAEAGIDLIPSNDFSLYDHVLDAAALAGAVPPRYGFRGDVVDPAVYFAMARGNAAGPAMEMTKWFDTNYHYIVPEFEPGMAFRMATRKPVEEFLEAKAIGVITRPVLLGPVSLVLLGKVRGGHIDRADVTAALSEVYEQVLRGLAAAGAEWVQIDEPCLGLDLSESDRALYGRTYERLSAADTGLKVLIATYFSDLRENLPLALRLPVAGIHLDLVRAPGQLLPALDEAPPNLRLSLGVIDGRGIWRADLHPAIELTRRALERAGSDRIEIAPSCSLLHVPVDLAGETQLDPDVRGWLAFAKQKLHELRLLARAVAEDSAEVREQLAEHHRWITARRRDPRTCDPDVRRRVAGITPRILNRASSFPVRRKKQAAAMPLPLLPTTSIGSFPQTTALRRVRAAYRTGKLPASEYDSSLKAEIERAIRFQEETGLDVLVHGEFERNDMVEYFGEQLNGFAFTRNGWVQSYGSRCVKPPVLYGDASRPQPMTVRWARFAQSLTDRPVKGMLTGPVTMMKWSFVRDDLAPAETCMQLALALRDEVADLEAAGIRAIQVDEPALREGLPLRAAERESYLRWSVDAFRLATAGAADETQIHTHMCYSEFAEILDAVIRMDADVISIEAARSQMELLEAFKSKVYPNDIGPGVYDIHSPRVPDRQEIEALIRKALQVFRAEQLWVNPDCGLKTRRWDEVRAALGNMVAAAHAVRHVLHQRALNPGR